MTENRMPTHVTPDAIYRLLDRRMTLLQKFLNDADAIHIPAQGRERLYAAIGAMKWAKAEIAALIECPPAPPVPLTPEQHWRAEDASQDAEAARMYRWYYEPPTD